MKIVTDATKLEIKIENRTLPFSRNGFAIKKKEN